MATYTSKEMNGSGSLGGELSGTQIFTITNPLNSLNNRNTGYLTLEGNATANQNLSITTYLTGAFSAFNGVSDRGLVYNSTATHWSISVAGSGGSFAFTPTNDIAAGSYYIKSTGLFSLTVESDVEERFVMSVRIGESAPEGAIEVSPKISLGKPSELSPDRIIGSDVAEKIEGETFTLPWIGTYDVDWGDGTKQTGVTDSQTHTYATSGDYDIKVKAATGRIYFNNSGDKSKVIDIKNWGTCIWTSMQVAFTGCNSLTEVTALDTPDLSSVTNMASMFLFSTNLSTIQNINSWNISNVQNIGFIFGNTNFNQEVGNWDTSNVTDMSGVFWKNTQFNHNVGNWNTSNVTTVYKMFDNNKMNHSLAGWDISNITNFGGFMTLNTNLSPENYDATLMSWALQSPQPNVNIAFRSKHTYRAASAMQTLIDTYGWTITDGGLVESPEFVISVKTDNAGGSDDNQFTLPFVGTYDVDWGDGTLDSGVTNTQTHTYASAGTYDVAVTATTGRIYFNNGGDKSKLLDIKNWGTCQWTDMTAAFYGSNSLTNVSAVDIINLTNCTSLTRMFRGSSVSQINTSNWDVSNITSLYQTFTFCSNIQSLDVSNWDVSNVYQMESLFRGMTALTTLDVSSWDTSNVSHPFSAARFIFMDSPNINPDISNWVLGNNNLDKMLEDADSFDRSLANWDISSTPNLINFMQNASGMSTANYDATLISWASQNPTPTNANFGGSQYSYEAAAARQTLIDTYGWTITDGGQVVAPEFALKWETTTPNEEIQIGVGSGTFDYVIDWGDGTVESYNTDANISHTYADAGDHITKITGDFPHINMGDASVSQTFKDKLYEIVNWGNIAFESLAFAFQNCSNVDLRNEVYPPNLSNCTSIQKMFLENTSLGTFNNGALDWSDWDVSNLISFYFIFDYRSPVSSFNASNWVINPSLVFGSYGLAYSISEFNVTNWDVSQRTSLANLFLNSAVGSIIGLETWDVSNVNNYTSTFSRPLTNNFSISDIQNWNIADGAIFGSMFQSSGLIIDVSTLNNMNLKPSKTTTMFAYGTSVDAYNNLNLNNWDMSLCTRVDSMFRNTSQFQKDLFSTWDITNISDFRNFFEGSQELLRENYDATLIAWEATLQATYPNGAGYPHNISITFGNSQYTLGGAAEAARNTLINTYGWTITDGGGIFVGVLDTYPNASAAYSLRDLASASVGSAVVRVRRSSDNTEQDFTATEITDGTLTTFTGVNDGFVTVWYDQSTNSNNAIQPTATRQPQIVDSGVVILENNNPSIKFDNTNDGFTLTSTINGGQYSIFTVDKPINLGVYQSQYFTDSISNPRQYILRNLTGYNTNGSFNIYRNTILDNSITNGFQELMYFESTVNTTNKIDVLFARQNYIDGWGSTFQEIIIYPTNQSANKTGIEANINSKYKVYGDVFVSGLLFDYPDAKAAFSLRQLGFYQNGYEPLAVRVRRSSDNTEQDFTSAEITDGTLTTFTGANDGFVSVWYDQSGNSNNASQNGLTTRQPQIVSNGNVILENGKPAIELNISNQILGLKSDILGGQYSIFTVDKTNGGGYFTDGPSPRQYISKKQNLSSYEINGNFDIYRNSVLDSSIYTNSQELLYFKSNTTTTNVIRTILNNGGSTEALLGNVQEMVIYDTDQSANRTGIETNINTEYTIYEVPVYTDNLVASYSFDTDFSDYTGNNDLTASGDATAGVAIGKVNDCLEVDGVDDYSIAVDSNDFSFTNGSNDLPFSISVWANGDNLGTGNLVNKRNVGSYFEYQVFILSSQVVVNLFNQGSASSQLKTRVYGTYNNNTWYNIIVTYDGSGNNSGLKVYVNGVLPTQTLDPVGTYVGMSNTTSPFTIGSFASGVDDFDGKIDEVHVWKNRELTSTEVLEIYNTENAGNSILP